MTVGDSRASSAAMQLVVARFTNCSAISRSILTTYGDGDDVMAFETVSPTAPLTAAFVAQQHVRPELAVAPGGATPHSHTTAPPFEMTAAT